MTIEESKEKIYDKIARLQSLEDSLPHMSDDDFSNKFGSSTLKEAEDEIDVQIDQLLQIIEHINDPAIDMVLEKLM